MPFIYSHHTKKENLLSILKPQTRKNKTFTIRKNQTHDYENIGLNDKINIGNKKKTVQKA